MATDERKLIRMAQEGDLTAFNRLVLAYQDRAYGIAFRIMGEHAAAEDATQEAFISAYRNIRRFRGGSFRAWLFRIVTNACYDELRRRKRRPQISLDGSDREEDDRFEGRWERTTGSATDPHAHSERSELARAIQDCINRLPADFRAVVVLVDVQGFDYKEAAQVVDTPVGTVKSRLARARARLRDCLKRYRELLPDNLRLQDEAVKK
jgi:RNA polymerase sigma-70 factor (ECF subfamily)